jgi:hypothetical protein
LLREYDCHERVPVDLDAERDGVAETSATARELYDRMLELYPDRANPGSLWGSARAAKESK